MSTERDLMDALQYALGDYVGRKADSHTRREIEAAVRAVVESTAPMGMAIEDIKCGESGTVDIRVRGAAPQRIEFDLDLDGVTVDESKPTFLDDLRGL